MNLPKAIELSRMDLNQPGSVDPNDLGAAHELGIEAMKRIQAYRNGKIIAKYAKLPGETEE